LIKYEKERTLQRKDLIKDSVKYILVHSSESPQDLSATERLDLWITDRKSKGYTDLGFHYIILPTGEFMEPQSIFKAGTHTARYNDIAVGVLIVSEKGKKPNASQLESLQRISQIARSAYPQARLKGVGELTGSSNPYFNVSEFI
jgi:hypothetical protein